MERLPWIPAFAGMTMEVWHNQGIAALASPPGNRLEALVGDRKGQHSIRINDQWRICFVWRDDAAYDVEIVDYHQMRLANGAEERHDG
jgi:hypothetical protein